MNESDPFTDSAEFYRRVEACLGSLIEQRPGQFFRVAPANVRSVGGQGRGGSGGIIPTYGIMGRVPLALLILTKPDECANLPNWPDGLLWRSKPHRAGFETSRMG